MPNVNSSSQRATMFLCTLCVLFSLYISNCNGQYQLYHPYLSLNTYEQQRPMGYRGYGEQGLRLLRQQFSNVDDSGLLMLRQDSAGNFHFEIPIPNNNYIIRTKGPNKFGMPLLRYKRKVMKYNIYVPTVPNVEDRIPGLKVAIGYPKTHQPKRYDDRIVRSGSKPTIAEQILDNDLSKEDPSIVEIIDFSYNQHPKTQSNTYKTKEQSKIKSLKRSKLNRSSVPKKISESLTKTLDNNRERKETPKRLGNSKRYYNGYMKSQKNKQFPMDRRHMCSNAESSGYHDTENDSQDYSSRESAGLETPDWKSTSPIAEVFPDLKFQSEEDSDHHQSSVESRSAELEIVDQSIRRSHLGSDADLREQVKAMPKSIVRLLNNESNRFTAVLKGLPFRRKKPQSRSSGE